VGTSFLGTNSGKLFLCKLKDMYQRGQLIEATISDRAEDDRCFARLSDGICVFVQGYLAVGDVVEAEILQGQEKLSGSQSQAAAAAVRAAHSTALHTLRSLWRLQMATLELQRTTCSKKSSTFKMHSSTSAILQLYQCTRRLAPS
jgi:hypothetical protein